MMTVNDGKQRLRRRWDNAVGLMVGVLFTVFLLGVADWEADLQKQVRMDSFRDRISDLARIAELDINNRIKQFDDTLLVLREAYVADPTRMLENIRLVRSGPLADPELMVIIVDREGYLAFTDTPDVKPRLYLGDRSYFRFFADGGKDSLYIDEPSFGRVTQRHTLPMARPIYDRQGGFSGVIALSAKQQSLLNIDPGIQLTGDTTITLVNQSGAIVSRSRDLALVQGTKIAPQLLNPMLEGLKGVFSSTATHETGVEHTHIIAYRQIFNQETPLIVYAESSTEDVLHEALLQRRVLMGSAVGTSLIVMVLIAVYLKHRNITAQLIDSMQSGKEQEYAILTQTSLDGFFIADVSARIVDTNTTFCKMLGYTREEMLHLHVTDVEALISPEQIAARIGIVREAGADRFQSRYRCKDGTIIDVEISVQYIDESGGRFFVFVRNITERKQAEKSLQTLTLRQDAILSAVPDIIVEVDTNKVITWVNRAGYEFYGDDVIGKESASFFAGDQNTYEIVQPLFLAEEKLIVVESWQRRQDGEIRLLTWRCKALEDAHGTVIGALSTARDTTERKEAEQALLREKLFSEKLLNASGDTILLFEPDTSRAVRWNKHFSKMSGYLDEEIATMSVPFDLHSDKDIWQAQDAVAKIFRDGLCRVELSLITKNGTVIPFEYIVTPVETEDGKTLFLSIGRDITERKQTENALKDNAQAQSILLERLNQAQQIAKIGTWEWNVQTDHVWWSDETYRIFGVTPEHFVPSFEANSALIHPDDLPLYKKSFEHSLQTGVPLDIHLRVVTPDGSLKYCQGKGKVIHNNAGQPSQFIGTIMDISELKQAEGEKALLESKYQQAQKMESVGLLAGGVAHDFNNMLGVILGYTELAMDHVAPTLPLFADLKKIQDAAQRSADLTRQLLTFARKQNVTPKALDLNETVEGILKMLRRLIGEDIDLSWTPGRGLWSIKMDPAQIDQVLANLCVNARDAIAGVGSIAVGTENITLDQKFCAENTGVVPGDYVRVTVKDSGCGMDQQTINHIFEPFFTTKGVGEGTGLGLATVYGAIKQNNGFIDVTSEPGQGTLFTLYLPRYVADAGHVPLVEAVAKPAARGHETILLVEDELTLLNMTTTMLQRLGYTVLAANTPSEAFRLVRERTGKIHLLATDVIMPDMNGLDLQKQLLAILPGMKCLFISGYTADVIAQQGVLDEGLHFIQKPFSQKNLATKVREALDG